MLADRSGDPNCPSIALGGDCVCSSIGGKFGLKDCGAGGVPTRSLKVASLRASKRDRADGVTGADSPSSSIIGPGLAIDGWDALVDNNGAPQVVAGGGEVGGKEGGALWWEGKVDVSFVR